MDELKQNIAKKLIFYRKKFKLTQSEVAEKISYSDKSVSKWERAEALPDVAVLKALADIYGTTVEHLFSPEEKHMKFDASFMQLLKQKRTIIICLSVSLVWFLATLLFVVLKLFVPTMPNPWWCFLLAIPTSFLVTTVFFEIWTGKISRAISASFLMWSAMLTLFLMLDINDSWLFFIVAVPLQIIIVFWYLLLGKMQRIKRQKIK